VDFKWCTGYLFKEVVVDLGSHNLSHFIELGGNELALYEREAG
jgi:hypothetical protein